jgi:hypothetical protein
MKTSRRSFLERAGAMGVIAYLNKLSMTRARAQKPVRIGGQGALSGARTCGTAGFAAVAPPPRPATP